MARKINIKSNVFIVKNIVFLLYVASIPLFAYSTSLHWINWLLAILFLIIWIIYNKNININKKLYILMFWFLWTGLGLLVNGINLESGLHRMITTCITWLIVIVIASYISSNHPDLVKRIFAVLFFAIVIMSLPALLNISSLNEPIRNSFGLYNPNHSSFLFGLAVSFGMYLISITKYRFIINAEIVGIFILLIGIMATGSRQGLIISFIGIVMSSMLFFNWRKVLAIVLIIISLLFIFVEYYQDTFNQFYIVKRINRTISTNELNSNNVGDEVRLSLIKTGLEIFRENPIIGVGFDQYRENAQRYGVVRETYAHNNYIEILVSSGLPGFIAYYSFMILLLFSSIRNYKISSLHKLMLIIICLLLLGDMVRVTYYQNIEPFLIGVIIAVESSSYNYRYFDRKQKTFLHDYENDPGLI